jgi:hypothetical protein
MRHAAKIDANQPEIVNALRDVGATVLPMHSLGHGAPDLAVGWQGRCYLLELKDGTLPPSRRKLTPDELKWHEAWRGHVAVVMNVDEALQAIGAEVQIE